MLLASGGNEGVIKSFNHRRGFGFIKTSSGADVFVHQSVLRAAGIRHTDLSEGTHVWFESGPNPKYPDRLYCTALRLAPGGEASAEEVQSEDDWSVEVMQLKFFKKEKGFGFFFCESKPDVYFHNSVVKACGVSPLVEGVLYEVTYGQGQKGKGLEAKKIKLHQ
jgi:cold shock CspA family protein